MIQKPFIVTQNFLHVRIGYVHALKSPFSLTKPIVYAFARSNLHDLHFVDLHSNNASCSYFNASPTHE